MSAGNRIVILVLFLAGISASEARAESVLVAVASNFSTTAAELVREFQSVSEHELQISSASTGKLFAQISNGAPFDVLLAADAVRPERLASNGLGVPDSRFTYAIGRLVLWSRDPKLGDSTCRQRLENLGADRLAIANPNTAPYGAAARQMLKQLGLWDRVRPRLVMGENITQTLQFVATGNASLGFVALSQIGNKNLSEASCSWVIEPTMHDAIEQQAILLNRATHNAGAREFLQFLRSESGRAIIARNGYLLAGAEA